MFENKKINDIHATRYIASFVKICNKKGVQPTPWIFEQWLETTELAPDDIGYIMELYNCGKMELEHDIVIWLATRN